MNFTNSVDFSYKQQFDFIDSYGEIGLPEFAIQEDGPHQCICQDGFASFTDDDDNLVACFDCKNIDLDCISCSNTEVCDVCGTENKMLTPDGTSCIDKLYGCKIKFES